MANPIFDQLTPGQQRKLLEDAVLEIVSADNLENMVEFFHSTYPDLSYLNEGELQSLFDHLDDTAAPLAWLVMQYLKHEVAKTLNQ